MANSVSPATPVSLALTVPAVRMLAVSAIVDSDGETTIEMLPVVAIAAHTTPHGHLAFDALVVCPDTAWGVVKVDDLDTMNSYTRLATAPWAPEEDETRLAGIIAEVCTQAIQKNAKEKSKRRSA